MVNEMKSKLKEERKKIAKRIKEIDEQIGEKSVEDVQMERAVVAMQSIAIKLDKIADATYHHESF